MPGQHPLWANVDTYVHTIPARPLPKGSMDASDISYEGEEGATRSELCRSGQGEVESQRRLVSAGHALIAIALATRRNL